MPTALELAVALTVKLGLAIALVGVLHRGLYRRNWSFLVYLLAVLIYTSTELVGIAFYAVPGLEWPRVLWNWNFWNFQQTTFAVLKMAVAVELAARVVAAFPGTWRLTRLLLGAGLFMTTALVTFGMGPRHPLLATGAIWLFATTSLVVVLFSLPVDRWYRALLIGFVPYLFIFGTIQTILADRGLGLAAIFGQIDQFAYLGLVLWFAYSAWRRQPIVVGIPLSVMRRLGLAPA